MPGVHSNSCPSSRWCHPTISSSVVPFSSCPQSLPASGSFPMSQPFEWGGQSNGVSASASVPPMNTQDLSPSGWTGWISLQSKGLSRVGQLVPKPSPLSHSPSYSLPLKAFPGGSARKESACNAGELGSIPGLGRSPGEGISYPFQYSWTSLVAQLVKYPPAMQETWVWFRLGRSPGEGNGSPLQYLAWRIPGLQRVGHNRATFTFFSLSLLLKSCHWIHLTPTTLNICSGFSE